MSLSPAARSALAMVALTPIAIAGIVAWVVLDRPDPRPGASPQVRVQIPRGASPSRIIDALADAGLAERPEVLRWTLRISGTFAKVQAGSYNLPADANALEVAELLERPAEIGDLQLMLVPGETVWHVARRVDARGFATAADFLDLAADHAFVHGELGLPAGPLRPPRPDGYRNTYLEGFLFPATYDIAPSATARDVIGIATARFRRELDALLERWRADWLAVQQRWKIDAQQLVTLASLVEREVVDSGEGPRVAGVLFNRLDRGMKLEIDPTLIYRPDRLDRPPGPGDRRDAANPYNTYAHPGLPPGPICSPGRAALEAVLRPERHDFLFFVARRDGTGRHDFSRTFAEHKAKIDQWLRRKKAPR